MTLHLLVCPFLCLSIILHSVEGGLNQPQNYSLGFYCFTRYSDKNRRRETRTYTQRCARRDQGQRDGARAVFARERRTKDAVVVIAMVAANAGGVGLRFRLDARASGSTRERKQHREVDGSHTHNALDEW